MTGPTRWTDAQTRTDMAPGAQKALKFYQQIIELMPGIIYVFNHQTQKNEYSNTSIASLLGYTAQEVLELGENVLPRLIHPDDLPRLGIYFADMAQLEDGETSSIDYRVIARDGAVIWFRSNDTVLERAADGSLLRHVGVSTDVTDQVEKSERLAKVNASLAEHGAELERANQELEQLAYIATHDLKGPLSNLSYMVEAVKEETLEDTPEVQELIRLMQRTCQKASQKLQALVEVAQVRSGELKPRVMVDLDTTVAEACSSLEHEILAANARITKDFQDAPTVFFPPYELTSAIENLISNSIKYAHSDRDPLIHVSSRCAGGAQQAVELRIRDNGRGLNLPRDREKVFGLFKSAHVAPKGSGVALYTIQKILQRFGGDITVDSVQNAWTEFTLTFPDQATCAEQEAG